MDFLIGDVRAAAESMFLSGNWIYLGMVIAAVLVGAASMRNLGQIICTSVLAMLVLAIIWIVYRGATSEAPTAPGTYMSQLESGWANLGAMTGSSLVAYLIAFAVVILVLFLARSLLSRG